MLPLKAREEDNEGRQEVSTSLAAAEEISSDAAAAVLFLRARQRFSAPDWVWKEFS